MAVPERSVSAQVKAAPAQPGGHKRNSFIAVSLDLNRLLVSKLNDSEINAEVTVVHPQEAKHDRH